MFLVSPRELWPAHPAAINLSTPASWNPFVIRRIFGGAVTAHSARDALTAREREVLGWVVQGKTNPEIAEILWVAPCTVRKHLENVFVKLGVHTRTAAATRFLGVVHYDNRPP
jgi:DNA-binding CsgD family transcriptional regulator